MEGIMNISASKLYWLVAIAITLLTIYLFVGLQMGVAQAAEFSAESAPNIPFVCPLGSFH